MSCLKGIYGLFKTFILIILILAVAIPIRYGTTDHFYLIFRILHSSLSLKHTVVPDENRPTLSADYRAFESLLRMKPIAESDSQMESSVKIKELRLNFGLGRTVRRPSECSVGAKEMEYNKHTVKTYWIDNRKIKSEKLSDKILIYFHGGGYMLGSVSNYSGVECGFSNLFDMITIHVEYRLCPENPLPAAVNDAVAVYRALLRDNISPSQLIIMGDSAGGGLSLLTIQALLARNLPLPRGVIVLSPWTDLSTSSDSYVRNKNVDAMLNTEVVKWIATNLLDPNNSQLSLKDPLVSPIFGSFKNFPPTYVVVGTAEILQDDSIQLVEKLQKSNVDFIFEEGLHLMHIYPVFYDYYPEARHTLNNINNWIRKIFNENSV